MLMHLIKNILFLLFVIFSTGCFSTKNIEVAGTYAYPESGAKKEIYDLIVQLTSSNFFEYTQAARKLFEKKDKVTTLEMLYKYKHLSREVDGSKILVCPSIIENILENASKEWLEENKENFLPGLNTIIEEELAQKKKGELDG